ncbi:MAG: hypothetical protein AB8H47_11760 [Bacteroidia bacterium]
MTSCKAKAIPAPATPKATKIYPSARKTTIWGRDQYFHSLAFIHSKANTSIFADHIEGMIP